ncbi:ADP-ribosylglycohydrolase [Algoriphagus ornithinivorans]|uniref:ADP-ribosylglycohydrolase n=1 Tax=Algoriphagus ornithinivorans TaxID=226506 RepID=A0A1I5AST4_9BACT|nr:ADP-ribosylglycohydrolase family protein [Algoriphagus ornithinivorans]SFN65528.1 ADP-ribosylglycohydrolase [Algoriphagus ornithinivorans]
METILSRFFSIGIFLFLPFVFFSCEEKLTENQTITINPHLEYSDYKAKGNEIIISREKYENQLYGFWLGQCIANWTGLITEMDKIGGDGLNGKGAGFYTRNDWGGLDQPAIWEDSVPEPGRKIDFVLIGEQGTWGADDDTDIEYIYQSLMYEHQASKLTPQQIRDGWLKHIYSDQNTPFIGKDGKTPENYLWVSNQRAHDLMREGLLPPATGDSENNPDYEMIDSQLTTEIFGLFAPGRPDIALEIATLPIQTTARNNAEWASQFYVVMHSLAPVVDTNKSQKEQVFGLAQEARAYLPEGSVVASMFDFVWDNYHQGIPWEETRDSLHHLYQIQQKAGNNWYYQDQVCNGCFAAGINFGAGIISLLYGEGDFKETIKIGALAGWDSDNPTATWGGLLGFLIGKEGIEKEFGQKFSNKFNIHRTRGGFPNEGIDTFENMAKTGIQIIDRVIQEKINGGIKLQTNQYFIPKKN